MALILHIDCAGPDACVSLAEKDHILSELIHKDQMNHASFLQTAIADILEKSNKQLAEIEAVSVSAGPGSYTGLRVGLASAKGICYTLNKPLILLNTLEIMAERLILKQTDSSENLYAPMIDARRMEVFTAIYDDQLQPLLAPGAYVVDGKDFVQHFESHNKMIYFFGTGMEKWKEICPKGKFAFVSMTAGSAAQNKLAQGYFDQKRFADVAYSEPLYFKSFYTTAKI